MQTKLVHALQLNIKLCVEFYSDAEFQIEEAETKLEELDAEV